MTLKRINCYSTNCNTCQHHVLLKYNLFGTPIYTCAPRPKKHKVIKAENCKEFRCNNYGSSVSCNQCNLGETVIKILKK